MTPVSEGAIAHISYLTFGKSYMVIGSSPWDGWVKVLDDRGAEAEYRAHRFRLADAPDRGKMIRPFPGIEAPSGHGAVVGALPDDNPKTRFGVAKPPLSLIPGQARVLLAEAFRDGARKYGPANWRVDLVTASTYLNAAERHLISWQDGEENAEDSGVHHLAHAAACLLILLDAQASGTLKDDRPTPANTSRLIRENTKPLA